ncbi:MAG TPA: class I SAM-dependent methyltransferase [Armatimonadetes bacterium]|nr:class I SAM-dependent methyltransferase [Armatimonadota bacterium]
MSDSHRRENHSPVPCWNAEADLGQRDAPGDAPAAASGDWLLLLPLSAGAVALDLGCGDGALSLELAHYCDQVVAVDAEPANVEATRRRASDAGLSHLQACRGNLDALISARRRFDLVVVRDPRRALAGVRPAQAVERLAELVAPQGCLAIAVGNPPEGAMPRQSGTRARGARWPWWGEYGARRLHRALEAAGFPNPQILAAVPDPHQPEILFPVTGEAQGRVAGRLISRCLRPGRASRRTLLYAATALSQWRAARWTCPGFWVIARAPACMRATMAEEMIRRIVARPRSRDWRRGDPVERARVALRARELNFVLSRAHAGEGEHAALLVVPTGWGNPACILRAGRWRSEAPTVGEEEVGLTKLRSQVVGRLRESLPEPLGTSEVREHHAAAHAYLPGVPLHQKVVAASPRQARAVAEHALHTVAAWLAELHEQTSAGPWIEGEAAVERVRPLLIPTASAASGWPLLQRVAGGIAGAGLRLGAAHNRLRPCHILLQEDGIAVTGWEHLALEGLPLVDLLGFAHALGAVLAGGGRVDPGVAWRFAYREENWYSRAVRIAVDGYCERASIDSDAVPFYLATTYLRAAALQDPLGKTAPLIHLAGLSLDTLDWR